MQSSVPPSVPIPSKSISPRQSRARALLERDNEVNMNETSTTVDHNESSGNIPRDLIELLPDATCIVDGNGTILHANVAFHKIATTFTSVSIFDIWQDVMYDASFVVAVETLRSSDICMSIAIGYDEDKDNLEWVVSGKRSHEHIIVTARNQASSLLYVKYKDLEELRQLEEEMQSAFAVNAQEHVKAKEREVLAQFQLNEALVKSQALSDILETKRMFVRSVSHEVRTPLNVVASGIQYLTRSCAHLDTKITETIEELRTSCDVAIDILTDLLTYEKIEGGVQELELKELELEKEVKKHLDQFRTPARQKSITMTYNCNFSSTNASSKDGCSPIVMADYSKLGQVIRNLVSNAIKFSRPGTTVEFAVLVLPTDDDNCSWVRFQVRDEGPGISKEDQARLFKEVVQFRPNDLQKGGGSGLGLWISRGIMELHHGRIGVESEGEGLGCTFFFELQLAHMDTNVEILSQVRESIIVTRQLSVAANDPKMTMNLVAAALSVEFTSNVESILIVDDSVACRKMTMKMLESPKNMFTEASDGLEAIIKVKGIMEQNKTFSIILMDNEMPGIDGLSATSIIRKMGYKGKIFGVTGNGLDQDKQDFVNSGADHVFVKPLTAADFEYIMKDGQANAAQGPSRSQ